MGVNREIKLLEGLLNTKKMRELKIGNIMIKMDYLNKGEQFDECILNILKKKIESSDIDFD